MQRLENGRFEHLDTQAGLAPVPSLSVVAESEELANGFVVSSVSREDIVCGFGGKDFVGVVFREPASPGIITHRMLLSVRSLIHCGTGRFCFWALASFCLVRKDLWL